VNRTVRARILARLTATAQTPARSIVIDAAVLEQAALAPYTFVDVIDIDNGRRLEAFVLAGARGTGAVAISGVVATDLPIGDELLILVYGNHSAARRSVPPPLVIDARPADASATRRVAAACVAAAPARDLELA
jgi:aspartate 1-decarboxylase